VEPVITPSIKFMGAEFTQHSAISMAAKLLVTAKETVAILRSRAAKLVPLHQKYLMFTHVGLAKSNYGPMVDQNQSPHTRTAYGQIDKVFADYLKEDLFNFEMSDNKFKEFILDHRLDGGLELMFPEAYYDAWKKY